MTSLKLKGAFIGEELEYKKNVSVEIDERGSIVDVYERRSGNGNFIALPALTNAHIHSADYAFLETGNWLELEQLVAPPSGLKHKLLESASFKKIKAARTEVVKLNQRAGVVHLADFVERNPDKSRVRIKGVKHLILARPEKNKDIRRIYKSVDGLGLPDVVSYSKEELKELGEKFKDKVIMVHVSETKKLHEMHDLDIAMDVLGPKAIVHGTFLDSNEIKELAEEKIGVVLCPRSNLWFSAGKVPEIEKMLEEGVKLSLGTDNAGWIKPDIWREMEVTALILRFQEKNFNKPIEILKMVTVNPVKMLGLDDVSIRKGNKAAFVLLDHDKIGIERAGDPAWSVVKRGGPESVVGVVLYETLHHYLFNSNP